MAHFYVLVNRDCTESTVVDVDADNREEALAKALHEARAEAAAFTWVADSDGFHGEPQADLYDVTDDNSEPFTCSACGREEIDCSAEPCAEVIADREAEIDVMEDREADVCQCQHCVLTGDAPLDAALAPARSYAIYFLDCDPHSERNGTHTRLASGAAVLAEYGEGLHLVGNEQAGDGEIITAIDCLPFECGVTMEGAWGEIVIVTRVA